MRWQDGFIAVDWGTTSRRAYWIDPQGGCVATVEDQLGVLSVSPGGFPAAIDELCWVEADRVAIVPGVSLLDQHHADVMRGEEMQMFGALAAGLVPDICLIRRPGMHNKWISLDMAGSPGFER